jgi:hypothetical protein
MKNNSHLHIKISSELLKELKDESKESMITLSELCRIKFLKTVQLERIENKIDKLLQNGN